MAFVPWVKCQRNLLEKAAFFGYCSPYAFVQHIKILLAAYFVGFFNPRPAQAPVFHRNGGYFKGVVKSSKVYFLPRRLIGHFKGTFLYFPQLLRSQPPYCPLKLGKAAVFKRSENLSDYQQVGAFVFHHIDYVPQGGCLAFL